MNATEKARAIRVELKSQKINSHQVSVRSEYFSGGSAIRVLIRDADISLAMVKKIAEAHEHIFRNSNGEILSGGNCYVTVSYDQDARDALTARYLRQVEAAVAKIQNDHELIEIEGTPYTIGRVTFGPYGRLSLWDGSYVGECFNAREAASLVAHSIAMRT